MPPFSPALRRLALPARIALTFAIGGWVYSRVDWHGLGQSVEAASASELAVAMALQVVAAFVAAQRWRLLLRAGGIVVSLWSALRLSLIGLFFSLFMLGSTGGDALRFTEALRHAPGRKAALLLSLVQDRAFGLGSLLLLLSGLFAAGYRGRTADEAMRAVIGIVFIGAVAFAASGLVLALAKTASAGVAGLASNRAWGLVVSGYPGPLSLPVLGLSLLNHALNMASACFVAWALGISLPACSVSVIFGVAAILLSLPITIAGIGVRDGSLIWLFGTFGMHASGLALAFSFCLLGINCFWAAMGGFAFYLPRQEAAK